MASGIRAKLARLARRLLPSPEDGERPGHYRVLRRNMTLLMILVSVVPLVLMALINHHQYRKVLTGRIVSPMKVLLNKTRHSCEIFLAERRSAVSFIASAYSFEELADQAELSRVFQVMKREFGGFVDLGLIDRSGHQVSYSGPYELVGKSYRDQDWFEEVGLRGTYVSDVFMGHRKFPHFVIAVQRLEPTGESWIVRATIDTEKFNRLIGSIDLEPGSDAFVVNREGILQTPSIAFGQVLDPFPLPLGPAPGDPEVEEVRDPSGTSILIGHADLEEVPFTLVLTHPPLAAGPWNALQSDLILVLATSVVVILLVVHRLTTISVRRIETSEQRQRIALHQMEHGNKLASIGRLAAGVAHEINNPMAIIDQKAGLMQDLMAAGPDFPLRERFVDLTGSILRAVERCRTITHRLLGFARRMDTDIRVVDLNEVVREVLAFLEKEALHRNVRVDLDLAEDLTPIASDPGQLQQVFLNILNNAFAAVRDGGAVGIRSFEKDDGSVAVSLSDDGIGMTAETKSRIFEPFFTTKKEYGTGLGLSITYGIVKKLGGEIQVESAPGEGTTFTVTLPKEPPRSEGG